MTKTSWVLILIFSFFSCAKVVAPDGGPKDENPPEVVMSEPAFGATNFRTGKVELVFNEYIDIRQAKNQLIITPPLKKEVELKLKGKQLQLEFQEELLADRTYSLQFGSGIKDITEGNPLSGYRFVFSTGGFLDSGVFIGKVYDAYTKKPIEKGALLLYDTLELIDTSVLVQSPTYIAPITDGVYRAPFLRTGVYHAFAISDENKNYIYDKGEGLAFSNALWSTNDSLHADLLISFPPSSPKRPQLVSNRSHIRSIGFDPKPNPDSLKLSVIGSDKPLTWRWSPKKDSIHIFLPLKENDSASFIVQQGNRIDTLLYTQRKPEEPSNLHLSRRFDTSLVIRNLPQIHFNYPVSVTKAGNILIVHGKDTLRASDSLLDLSANGLSMKIQHPANTAGQYGVVFFPGALESTYTSAHDTLEWNVQVPKNDGLGKFIFYDPIAEDYRYELLDAKEEVIKRFSGPKFTLNQIKPGTYSLRRYLDLNRNGQWDPGQYTLNRQPEPMFYYTEPIEIRANWEFELEW